MTGFNHQIEFLLRRQVSANNLFEYILQTKRAKVLQGSIWSQTRWTMPAMRKWRSSSWRCLPTTPEGFWSTSNLWKWNSNRI